jgi:hypothetical protein
MENNDVNKNGETNSNRVAIMKLVSILIASESLRDYELKLEDTSKTGESSTLFYLKRLEEMLSKEFD